MSDKTNKLEKDIYKEREIERENIKSYRELKLKERVWENALLRKLNTKRWKQKEELNKDKQSEL